MPVVATSQGYCWSRLKDYILPPRLRYSQPPATYVARPENLAYRYPARVVRGNRQTAHGRFCLPTAQLPVADQFAGAPYGTDPVAPDSSPDAPPQATAIAALWY